MNNKRYENIFEVLENELNLISLELREYNQRYFFTQKSRYKSDLQIIEQNYTQGEILEIGSVPCHLTYCLMKLGYPIIGLDLDPERAEIFIKKHHLIVTKCNIENEKLPFDDNRFSLIIFNEIFEHLRIDPIFTLREINRVLKPDGIMILTTPNLYSLARIIKFILGRGINNSYKEFEKLHTLGHMGHIRVYSAREIARFLENTGFEIINVKYRVTPLRVFEKNKSSIAKRILDLCSYVIPIWRPNLVIISRKAVTRNAHI